MTTTAVSTVFYQVVEDTARDLYIRALKVLPPEVRVALQAAAARETSPTARNVLATCLRAVEIADERDMLICQDTGTPIYFVGFGTALAVNGAQVEAAIRRGTERATREHPLRSSVCTALGRKNAQTSTGYHIPVMHYEFLEGADYLDVLMVPKGSGSEQMSFMKMLVPADGVAGIKRFVVDSVVEAGGNPCPPGVVGVGIGGTSDLCMSLAKKAIARPLGSHNPDPEMARLEEELLEAVNRTGVGPQGLGGDVTAMAVHVEHADTHITQNPVAISMQCWPARRARARIYADGRVETGF